MSSETWYIKQACSFVCLYPINYKKATWTNKNTLCMMYKCVHSIIKILSMFKI